MFVDLEQAFDQVPREVIGFALRQKGVPEYLVNVKLSDHFTVKAGVHQRSA